MWRWFRPCIYHLSRLPLMQRTSCGRAPSTWKPSHLLPPQTGQGVGFTSRTLMSPPRSQRSYRRPLVARHQLYLVASTAVGAIVLHRLASWQTRGVGMPAQIPLWVGCSRSSFTQPAFPLSQTRTVSGWSRAHVVSAALTPLAARGRYCRILWGCASTVWRATMCALRAPSPPGASCAWVRDIRRGIAPGHQMWAAQLASVAVRRHAPLGAPGRLRTRSQLTRFPPGSPYRYHLPARHCLRERS